MAEDGRARRRRESQRDADARSEAGADQDSADIDRTLSDADQATSASDQDASDEDQRLADRDQETADRDQETADRERSRSGADAEADVRYRTARRERDASARERDSTTTGRSAGTAARLDHADRRDEIARLRDLSAADRDRTALARDEAAEARWRDASWEASRDLSASVVQLAGMAASLRDGARRERENAAADREAAARDRLRAGDDRRNAGLDELTGVFRRGNGELALGHEIARARRLDRPLVILMIDVDSLKAVNDALGHPAGDALLRAVSRAITATLRAYDVTVRWGGDEFACALSDVDAGTAAERITQIQAALHELQPGATISAGLALLGADDTLASLIDRADADLYRVKAHRGGHPAPRSGEG